MECRRWGVPFYAARMTPDRGGAARIFTVATAKTPDQGQGIGRLTVEAGAVALDSWPVVRRLVTHERGPVSVVTARFAPPWWRTAVILRGRGPTGSYGAGLMSAGQARRVRQAITEAGFELVDLETRFWRFPRSSFSATVQ
jgi:hypothetical protein